MSCKEVEELIFKNESLSAKEQRSIDLHCETCAGCRELVDDARLLSNSVQAWRSIKPVPEHEAMLTHKILNATERRANQPAHMSWVDYINRMWVRNAFAFISIALIVGFLLEPMSTSPSAETWHSKDSMVQSGLVLDTKEFVTSPLEERPKKVFSLIACIHDINCPPLIENKKKLYYENR